VIDLRRVWPPVAVAITMTVALAAQQSQQGGQPAAAQNPAQTPASTPAAPLPGTVTCPAPAPPATAPSRAFNAPSGLMLVQVTSTRVQDFEKFLGYVRDALAKTTDATLRNQAKSWKFFRVAEPGPNNDVLYALLLDPAVPCVDYGFGPILAAAIPDQAKLDEVWSLYKTSVKGGGTLMNFVPLDALTASTAKTPAPAAAPATQKPANDPPRPLDANPNRLPQ